MKFLGSFLVFILVYESTSAQVVEKSLELSVDYTKTTIKTRIKLPKGYRWEVEKPSTFADFLVHFPLKPDGFPLRNYKDYPVEIQDKHIAILDIEVGHKDLQQCADSWIRLYSEYLWRNNQRDKIHFSFTNAQTLAWKDYKKGIRTKELNPNKVLFYKSDEIVDTYESFRDYLNLIFKYAGTISLDRDSRMLKDDETIQIGDFFVRPGNPGHTVFIVGSAINNKGKRLFLLAEGYMPAQDIHIMKNPNNEALSPWYQLSNKMEKLELPRSVFQPAVVKRYNDINK